MCSQPTTGPCSTSMAMKVIEKTQVNAGAARIIRSLAKFSGQIDGDAFQGGCHGQARRPVIRGKRNDGVKAEAAGRHPEVRHVGKPIDIVFGGVARYGKVDQAVPRRWPSPSPGGQTARRPSAANSSRRGIGRRGCPPDRQRQGGSWADSGWSRQSRTQPPLSAGLRRAPQTSGTKKRPLSSRSPAPSQSGSTKLIHWARGEART